MIAYLNGVFAVKDPAYVIIDVQGVGYQARISLSTYAHIKELEKGLLHTFLHIKEDGHTLFGFAQPAEKQLFQDLISVNGIGPGTAMMVLSSMSVEDCINAIVREDLRTVQAVKGIGLKTAQRLILELKDKLAKELVNPSVVAGSMVSSASQASREALSALVMLGFARPVAEKALETIVKKGGPEKSAEQLIKEVLKGS
jgi:Holliday junction DNA helicase RuvA